MAANTPAKRIDLSTMAAALIAAAVTSIVYLPSLWNGFVNWDDQWYVYINPLIKTIDLKALATAIQVGNWHPLTMFSLALDYQLWGLNPFGYHLGNTVLHAANTFLAALLAAKLIQVVRPDEKRFSFVAALAMGLLFGIHPLHVESVAWISERKDVLCGFFFFLSVLFYISHAQKPSWKTYVLSFVFFILALLSKPMAVTLPLALIIIDFYPFRRIDSMKDLFRSALGKAPFFATAVILSFAAIYAQNVAGALQPFAAEPLYLKFLSAARGYIFYLVKTSVPYGLVPYYPHPVDRSLANYQYWGSVAVFMILSAGAVAAILKGKRLFPAVWAFYVITLLPVIGIVQVGGQAAADRYMYLPAFGIFLLAGIALSHAANGKQGFIAALVITAAVTGGLSYLTVKQTAVWKDSIALWDHEIKFYPERVQMAYRLRGRGYHGKGDVARAIQDYTTAISINPSDPLAYHTRALAYQQIGNLELAIADFTRAIDLDPNRFNFYSNRGMAFAQARQYERAIEDFSMAIAMDPMNAGAYINRGNAFLVAGRFENAMHDLSKADSISPGNPAVQYNLRMLYQRMGR